MAKPEEIGRGIVFLASPASSFTTGTNLVIDGALDEGRAVLAEAIVARKARAATISATPALEAILQKTG